MHNLLLQVFEQLDQEQIPYCLLRGYEELEAMDDIGDVDLLISNGHMVKLHAVLAPLGFVALPGWGRAPHRFFVAYDESSDNWLKLDVVSEVCFGQPIHAICTALAAGCLHNRRRHGITYIPSSEDEFVTLLLHCVLDKGVFAPTRRERLVELRSQITDVAYLSSLLASYWVPKMSWQQLAEHIDAGSWSKLLAERKAVAARLTKRDLPNTLLRTVRGRVLRKLEHWAGLVQPRAVTVALLAPDGAGKTTLATELTRTFYLPSRYIYMGSNLEASTIGLPTTRWLQAQSSKPKSGRNMPTWMLARGLRFPNTLLEQWYRSGMGYYYLIRGRQVIFDRYAYDAMIASRQRMSLKTRVRRWLLSSGAPKPDIVVMLDAPGEMLFARKGEHSPTILEAQRQRYLALQPHLPQMVVVDATRGAEDVRRKVTSLVWRSYGQRLSKNCMYLGLEAVDG